MMNEKGEAALHDGPYKHRTLLYCTTSPSAGYTNIMWNILSTPREHAVLPLELSSVEELASAQQRMYELVVTRVRMKLSSSETNFDYLVGPLEWLAIRGTWLA